MDKVQASLASKEAQVKRIPQCPCVLGQVKLRPAPSGYEKVTIVQPSTATVRAQPVELHPNPTHGGCGVKLGLVKH